MTAEARGHSWAVCSATPADVDAGVRDHGAGVRRSQLVPTLTRPLRKE
ncbi:hypothetical protein [Streptomyces chiangmaiensis]|uniref:Uncharacterized protein n=1 Tax=Streptomyces chiangmaiensis TaxID=766497 RepID=A0ABU7FBA4_9ACTN|nr:hypothetical protein [Streptomyces chiangmaiensis]MED7821462.1 hypothetical protein [Streptomyces chiangmaiensis]